MDGYLSRFCSLPPQVDERRESKPGGGEVDPYKLLAGVCLGRCLGLFLVAILNGPPKNQTGSKELCPLWKAFSQPQEMDFEGYLGPSPLLF